MTTMTDHAQPQVIESPEWVPMPVPACSIGDHEFVRAAGHAGRLLPAVVHDALVDFADAPPQPGPSCCAGFPWASLPHDPAFTHRTPPTKDHASEFSLLTVARRLGQPVGYEPEHGGDIVQNLVPVQATERPPGEHLVEGRADVPHRGGLPPAPPAVPAAALPARRPVTRSPRCRRSTRCCPTSPGESSTRCSSLGSALRSTRATCTAAGTCSVPRCRVLSGERDLPTMVFDADLMVGTDETADDALQALGLPSRPAHRPVALAGRRPARGRQRGGGTRPHALPAPDSTGTDRWLQRAIVVSDLRPSAGRAQSAA
jgi:hypothetical protein